MKVSADFKDILKLLIAHNVEFLLIGGYAVGYHGYPRPTGDLDIWIRLSDENARRTAQALQDFGYATVDQTLPYLKDAGKILRMGVPPFRLELSTTIDGVDFAACYENRQTLSVDDVPVPVISLNDLLINKRAAGRPKDLADVDELEKRNRA